jgi:poly(A) polymerase
VPNRETARSLAIALRRAGHEALLAGGCVRDALRGVEPKDYDIATSATPREVEALFPRTFAVGAAFGVVVVLAEDGPYEVATFREDRGTLDGRHPASVRFSDARTDAMRRDFTVNGMFEDPETGAILDFTGGREDLARRRIRTIGDPDARFREDHLRILRAVRFATTLDFTVDPETMRAARRLAPSVAEVSAERIRDEISKILLSGRGGRGLGLLHEAGLLRLLLPEVADLDGLPQPPEFHPEGDVLTHTRMLLDGYREGGLAVAFAALLHDVAKRPCATVNGKGRAAFPNHAPLGARMAGEILRRLRLPAREVEQVEALVASHMDWPNLSKMREAKRRRFLLREDFPLHRELHRLDCEASHRNLSLWESAGAERERLLLEPPPTRPLLGGDRLKALGFAPGPAFRRILDELVDLQLEGRVRTAAEAEEFVLGRYRPPDGTPIASSGGEGTT